MAPDDEWWYWWYCKCFEWNTLIGEISAIWEGTLQSVQVEVSWVCLGGCILISKECHCSCSFLKTWGNTHKQDTTQGQTSQRTRNGKPLQSLRVHWEQFIMILGVPTVSYTHVSHHCYCQSLVRWALFLHSVSLIESNTSISWDLLCWNLLFALLHKTWVVKSQVIFGALARHHRPKVPLGSWWQGTHKKKWAYVLVVSVDKIAVV